MNWTVVGVDTALRHRADAAARRADLPLGVWISEVILASVMTPPEPAAPILSRPIRHKPGLVRAMRSGVFGFLLGLVILGGSIWGFIYILGEEEAAVSPSRVSRTNATVSSSGNAAADRAAAHLTALRTTAAEGDPAAKTELAMIYLNGKDVAPDPAMAARFLEEAAVEGYADAQYQLGLLYEKGRGRNRDDTLAFFWHDGAATRGSIPAADRLGVLYAEGRGTTKDFVHAAYWFRRAAEAGDPTAQYALGYLYDRGIGVTADADEARRWWMEAAEKGNTDAQARIDGRDSPAPFAMATAPAVPSTSPTSESSSPAATPTNDNGPHDAVDVAEIQRLLKLLAFDPGNTDGHVTPETTEAIRNYQGIAGLKPDGQPSAELLASLHAVAGDGAAH